MEDQSAKLAGSGRVMGREVLLVLPFIVVIMLMLFFYISFPMRYWFSVRSGELRLMAGKLSWVDSQKCDSLESIPADGIDLTKITGQVFEREKDALTALRGLVLARIDERTSKLIDIEKQLADPYALLLKDLKAAKASGVDGLDANINVLQGWLNIYKKKVEKK